MSLTGDAYRFRRVEEIFHRIVELREAEERQAVLVALCEGDEALAEEVQGLLRASGEAEAGLAADGSAEQRRDHWIGRQVGPYRIEELLGHGGMGAVYKASRSDGEFQLQAAVKVLRSRLMSEMLRERFLIERQILASLSHPNIVRLIDGGVTPDGDAYLVMEYIDGAPLDHWIEGKPLRGLIELFVKICTAVDAAHRKFVVHRDLKPGNILVTKDGEPKLLDFGTSKLLVESSTPQAAVGARLTQLGFRAFTPDFASPEQILGGTVSTASDTYSLGVILYRLTTGAPPYRFESQSSAEFVRVLRDFQPAAPSAVSRAELKGDLDAIILKCMSKEPEQRYASAAELAYDLQSWLDGRPVIAREPTWQYWTVKFVGRHKGAIALGAAGAVFLAAGTISTIFAAREAREQEARANRQFHDVRQLNRALLFDFFDSVQKLPGSTEVQKEIVNQSLGYISKLQGEAPNDSEVAYDLVEAYQRLGDVNGNPYSDNLSNPKGAMETLNKGLNLATALTAKNPADDRALHLIARVEQSLGEVSLGMGDTEAAAVHLRKSIAAYDVLAGRPAATADLIAEASSAHGAISDVLGGSFGGRKNEADAEAELRRSIDLDQLALTRDPKHARAQRGIAIGHLKLGRLVADTRVIEAIAYFESALREAEALPASMRGNVAHLRLILLIEQRLAESLSRISRFDAAVAHSREALRIAESLERLDPGNSRARMDVAVAAYGVANALDYRGSESSIRADLEASCAHYQKSIAIVRTLLAAAPKNQMFSGQLCETQLRIAQVALKLGKSDEGLRALQESRAMASQAADDPNATSSDMHRAALVFSSDDLPASTWQLQKAAVYAERLNAATGFSKPEYLAALGSIYYKADRFHDASQILEKASAALPKLQKGEVRPIFVRRIEETLRSLNAGSKVLPPQR